MKCVVNWDLIIPKYSNHHLHLLTTIITFITVISIVIIIIRYVVCIAKGMKPHLVLNDEEKQQRFGDKYVVANTNGVGGVVGDDVG